MNNEQDTISINVINPVDYYNQNCVQDAFDLMCTVKGVSSVGIDALTVYVNKGDESKRMIVIENGMFVVKESNGLNLEVNKVYTPFMLLQKFKFKDAFTQSLNYVQSTVMNNKVPYIRVGTKYFKSINKIDRYGINRTELVYWEKTTLLEDYDKKIIDVIEKYDDFTINPDNKTHSPIINNNYNLYAPFEHEACKKEDYDEFAGWYWINNLIEHIFGTQYDLGMQYIKVLYDKPKQALPILVLISEERSTGKTTFVDFLNIMFGANMVLINPQDITNQFNGSYADKNIIAIEESRFEGVQSTEKLKNLATQKEILVNSKNIRQYSIPFYGKLIITSNDETKFSSVDTPEIRYWVRKVPTLTGKANHNILQDLKKEIPQFLYYLNTLPDVDTSKSRMVFLADEIATVELATVKAESRSGLFKDTMLHLENYALENTKVEKFLFTALHIKERFFSKDHKYEVNYINKVLKYEIKLERDRMQRFIPLETNNSASLSKVSGTPFIYRNPYFNIKFEDEQQTSQGATAAVFAELDENGIYTGRDF